MQIMSSTGLVVVFASVMMIPPSLGQRPDLSCVWCKGDAEYSKKTFPNKKQDVFVVDHALTPEDEQIYENPPNCRDYKEGDPKFHLDCRKLANYFRYHVVHNWVCVSFEDYGGHNRCMEVSNYGTSEGGSIGKCKDYDGHKGCFCAKEFCNIPGTNVGRHEGGGGGGGGENTENGVTDNEYLPELKGHTGNKSSTTLKSSSFAVLLSLGIVISQFFF